MCRRCPIRTVEVLREIHHVYIDLHLGTDAAPTAFSGATFDFDPILDDPRSYRFCNIANHRQDLTGLTIHTPTSGSFINPSPTQLDQSPGALPHHSPSRHHLTPRGSTAALESSANHVTYHTHGFTWPSLTADGVCISTQPPSVSDSSVSESIGTAITWDPNLLVPSEASPSVTPIASAAKSLRPDELTPEIRINGTGETSQAPAAPLIFQHPKSVPAPLRQPLNTINLHILCLIQVLPPTTLPRPLPSLILWKATSSRIPSHHLRDQTSMESPPRPILSPDLPLPSPQ